jgi:hypothetical protein
MKNIHILPTLQPSRLYFYKGNAYPTQYGLRSLKSLPFNDSFTNQNIYITSDEEIKENVYALINGVLCKTETREGKIVSRQLSGGGTMDICKSEYFEIILTTDQDLIKDGLQAIDDDFLKWFVKNSSCEKVEVDLIPYDGTKSISKYWNGEYKIIIPKEEPKQERSYSDEKEFYKYMAKQDSWKSVGLIIQEFIQLKLKEQDKKLYSEEDMKLAWYEGKKDTTECMANGKDKKCYCTNEIHCQHKRLIEFKEWFEQFKKK